MILKFSKLIFEKNLNFQKFGHRTVLFSSDDILPTNYREMGWSWLIFRVYLIHLFTACKHHLMALNLRHPANGLCNKDDTFSGKSADISINGTWKQTTTPHPNWAKLFRKIPVHSVRFQTRFHDNWSHCIKSNI